jgi:hypothetical protein
MLSAFFDGYARFEVIVKTLRKEGHTAVAIKGEKGQGADRRSCTYLSEETRGAEVGMKHPVLPVVAGLIMTGAGC